MRGEGWGGRGWTRGGGDGGDCTLQVGPRAGWLGEGARQFRLRACVLLLVCVFFFIILFLSQM